MSNDIVNAAQTLADVLAQENDALNRLDFPSATALVGAKYAALTDLAKYSPLAPALPPLAALLRHVGKLAAENQVLLEHALAVQTRVVCIVARACVPPPVAMQYHGHNSRASSHRATALAVSTRV